MVDQAAHDLAWEEALEEAIRLFEQGEMLNQQRFEELVTELEVRRAEIVAMPEDDPRSQRMLELKERAGRLEASAREGTGPTDQLSSILASLTGSDD